MNQPEKMTINPHGYWQGDYSNIAPNHAFDLTLFAELVTFFRSQKAKSILDMGCGLGMYVQGFKEYGFEAYGVDGHPDTRKFSNYTCDTWDLTIPFELENSIDWVLTLEVGEHIPKEFEATFIQNVHRNNTQGVVLSWAVKGQGGAGHFNEQDNEYIRGIFKDLGYHELVDWEIKLRRSASYNWFKNTIMVFKR